MAGSIVVQTAGWTRSSVWRNYQTVKFERERARLTSHVGATFLELNENNETDRVERECPDLVVSA